MSTSGWSVPHRHRVPDLSDQPALHRPLEGLRVVDAATLAAGPMVATMLGEFGAEVIKVEQPGTGDPLRTWGEQKDGIGLFWKSMSRNKQCVTLDLRNADGQELFHRLLDVSDVLVTNNRPSALAKWGLDYDSVHAAHPLLVMLHITGYGGGGPKSDRPGFGTLAEAMSGFAHVTGQPEGPPTLPPFFLADGVAAQSATAAVMMALYHRDVRGGSGQLIDVNLIEPLARLIETSTLAYSHLGKIPGRVGNLLPASAPRNAYETGGREVGRPVERVAQCRPAGLPRHRPARARRGPRVCRPGEPPAAGGRDRRARGGVDPRADSRPGDGRLRAGRCGGRSGVRRAAAAGRRAPACSRFVRRVSRTRTSGR